MAKLPRKFADAETLDDIRMGFHRPYVRSRRTFVNVDNGQAVRNDGDMPDETKGTILAAIKMRSKLSLDKIAKGGGWAGRSSVQRFFEPHYNPRFIPIEDAMRLSEAFEGHGDPPIRSPEIMAMAMVPGQMEVMPSKELPPQYMNLPRDVPVYGTAMGTYRDDLAIEYIEQSLIDYSETIDYFSRPPGYANRIGIYGVYISGDSQSPRFETGEIAFVDPKRPASIGDDVIVYLAKESGDDRQLAAVLIKRLVRRTSAYVELQQYNPPVTFQVETRRVSAIHRVIPNKELLAYR